MTAAEAIREKRMENGMTQKELAARLGVSVQAVSQWERGTAMPAPRRFVQMAAVLGTECGELMGVPPDDRPRPAPEEAEIFRAALETLLDGVTEALGGELSPNAVRMLESWIHMLGDADAAPLIRAARIACARYLTARGQLGEASRMLTRAEKEL